MALLAVAVLMALALHAAVRAPSPQRLVLYLGHRTETSDAGYKHFAALFEKLRPQQFSTIRLAYVTLPDDWTESVNAVSLALQDQPVLIVTPSAGSTKVARHAAGPVPIVFASYTDPVSSGLVDSLQLRADRMTGIDLSDTLDGKRFEILREAYPKVRTVAVLADAEWASDVRAAERIQAATGAFGLKATLLVADSSEELVELFKRTPTAQYDAWYVPATYLEDKTRAIILAEMQRIRKPCIYTETDDVEAGGLLSYTQDTTFVWPALVDLSARVLDGARPGAIPIVRPQRFELAVRINADTGVSAPAGSIVRRADFVIK